MILASPLEAHFGRGAGPDGRDEVAVHRLVTAHVAEAGQENPGRPAAAGRDKQAIRFEGNHALAAENLGPPQTAEQRWNLARVVERAGRPVVVLKGDEHALGSTVGTALGGRRPEPANGG